MSKMGQNLAEEKMHLREQKEDVGQLISSVKHISEGGFTLNWINVLKEDPKKGTGKKPKGSTRRLYTDENPKDTVH